MSLPRTLAVAGRAFVDPATNSSALLEGTNVVMKGPPWIPSVSEDEAICTDRWFSLVHVP